MVRVSYDFHIHTAASPCADEKMTPSNIIQLAEILEKQMIAITDHNTCVNCEAVMQVGKRSGIIVIPGMEIECMEEFHIITLFPTLEAAREIETLVWQNLPQLANRKEIFGEQQILDEEDNVVGEIERLLLTATQISVEDLIREVKRVGGIGIPAHIDRSSYSILSNFGGIPDELELTTLELSSGADKEFFQDKYRLYRMIQGSDAHYLEGMCEADYYLELDVLSKREMIKYLKNYK